MWCCSGSPTDLSRLRHPRPQSLEKFTPCANYAVNCFVFAPSGNFQSDQIVLMHLVLRRALVTSTCSHFTHSLRKSRALAKCPFYHTSGWPAMNLLPCVTKTTKHRHTAVSRNVSPMEFALFCNQNSSTRIRRESECCRRRPASQKHKFPVCCVCTPLA